MNKSSLSGLGRDFYMIQIAAFLNAVGARCGQFAIAWWVLGKVDDPLVFSTFVAVGTLADVLSRAAFGWLGDQYNRYRLLVGCYLVSAAATLALASLSSIDFYQPFLIGACLIVSGISMGIREPIQMSLTPTLVATERVSDAVRLRSIVGSSSALMGPLAAGILLGPLGVLGTLWLNALAVIIALVLIVAIKEPATGQIPAARQTSYLASWYKRTQEGFTALYRVKPEWNLSLLAFVVNFSLYPLFAVLFPVLINRYFPADLWLIAVTEGAFAFGLLMGSLTLVKRANHRWGRPNAVFSGFLLVGLAMFSCGIFSHFFHTQPWWFASVTVPLLFVGGVGLMMVTVNTSTVRVLATPDNYRNRIGSATSFISGMVIPFGTVIGGAFSGALGVSYAMVILGLLIVLAVVPCMFSAVLVHVLGLNDEQIKNAYKNFYPDAFPD
ncbi:MULTISPECIES: MFS transporter [Pseudomonas]|uniref:MFS transporter n=1 Tax=Pseudomonas quercus TaxID=2722792 RepID=A0ABX0YFV0_9PSED|nr:MULTISPECIES: MFS transporter [Pseudomonas]MBF7142538.1 MFS transporter [Pseudomonas sp. LY10J]NJP01076.1 MFS transporter [Pseudomonas quercus]